MRALAQEFSCLQVEEAFVSGTEPALSYDRHWERIMSLPWYQQQAYYLPKAGERMPSEVEDWQPIIEAWQGDEEGD